MIMTPRRASIVAASRPGSLLTIMTRLSVSLLGGFSVALDGKPITSFESNKVRALLAYLVTEADRAHSRDKLAALLWPDMSDQSARSNLRYALSNLRKAVGDVYASQPIFCVSKQTVQLNLDGNLEADVLTFSRQLAQSPQGLSNLEEAMRIYQGDFLDGFYIGSDCAFEEWVVLKREQLRRQALETLHHLTQAYRENGDLASALTAGWRLVDLEPWSEESHRELMLLLGLSGRRAAALSQYETCRRLLAEELNVEPSIETTRIYEQIRDGQIKPPIQTPETISLPVKSKPETKTESVSSIPEVNVPKPDGRMLRAGKFLFAGLLVIGILSAAVYSFIVLKRVKIPLAAPVHGEIVGPCTDQVLPSLCIANAQTGLIKQIVKDLPVARLDAGFSWSPQGKQIVFSASPKPIQEKEDNTDLYVIDRDGSHLHSITTGDFHDALPAWSPDGEWIAFHRNCALWLIHPDGTGGTALSSGLCATEITWSPDSHWIAFLEIGMRDGSRPATIRIYDRGGNDSQIVYTFDKQLRMGRIAWSPDGEQIFCFYNAGDQDHTILIDVRKQSVVQEDVEIPMSWFADFYPQWGK